MDDDALIAAADLVGRTGAKGFEIGYVNDDPPHRWYAHAQYRGARVIAEDHKGPVEAAEALARRLMTGGKCTKCGGLIALSDDGAFAYESATLTDGTKWDAGDAAAAGQCRWTRIGRRWTAGCHGEVRARARHHG